MKTLPYIALATQPATSQEGEAIAMARRCQQARHSAVEPVERDNVLHEAATLLRRLTATPTPPTLSEDLREALEPVIHWYQSDEHAERPLSDIVKDAVEDLQQDRACTLQMTEALRTIAESSHADGVGVLDGRTYGDIARAALARAQGQAS